VTTGVPHIGQAREATAARVEDIAPTLLAGLGLPLSRELAGTPLPVLPGQSAHYVDSYGRPSAPAVRRSGKPLDQEMIDRLRSLGYVK
jgi:hypothetical protein